MTILSICIATYNRSVQLEELVRSLLEIKSEDFEVVVTNNCSTDNTMAMLESIKDERLVVFNNQKPEPAYYNMILSIFNARGKYALYCNDRDVIFTERLIDFIKFLRNHNYSFLHIKKCFGIPKYTLKEYDRGFDSIIHHAFCDHPTGMVYNVELLKKNINKEDFKKYVQDIYTWCFLGRELVIYEKSAEYDNYLWDERPSIFKVQSASGAVFKGQLYFETEKTIELMKGVFSHIIGNPYFPFSYEQQKIIILHIFTSFRKRLLMKKVLYADRRECAHYGIKPRFISYYEMKKSYNKYFEECDMTLKNTSFFDELNSIWNQQKKASLKSLFKDCVRCDKTILSKEVRRYLNPNYRY